MMKKILLLVLISFNLIPIYAQSTDFDETVKEKNNVLFVGPKVGVTFTSMTQPKEVDLYDGNGLGLSGGLQAKTRFGRATENSVAGTGLFGVALELKYKQNKVKTTADKDLSISYFEVPVLAQIYPLAHMSGVNPLYVELGAAFAGTLSKSPSELTVTNPALYSEFTYHTGELKGFDVRGIVGLGYTVPNVGFDINARYYLGTCKLAKNFPCKMNSFEVSVAYLFNVADF